LEEPVQRGRERVLYVLDGELELEIDQLSGRIGRHEYAHVPSSARHALGNVGQLPLRILSVWSSDPSPEDRPA
jgi:mannose-6-phosphate isomerase-like protein (cupin superfamily)